MRKIQEPLKSFAEDSSPVKEKRAAIFFVDAEFKPLSVNKRKIAGEKEMCSFKNHIEFLPRVGDDILVEGSIYRVKGVIHSLPSMRSDCQKIYIMLE